MAKHLMTFIVTGYSKKPERRNIIRLIVAENVEAALAEAKNDAEESISCTRSRNVADQYVWRSSLATNGVWLNEEGEEIASDWQPLPGEQPTEVGVPEWAEGYAGV